MNQDKKTDFSHFSDRLDALANKLSMAKTEIAAYVGISRPMLYAYASGKSPITGKAWRKLEDAELKAKTGRTPDHEKLRQFTRSVGELARAFFPGEDEQSKKQAAAVAAFGLELQSYLVGIDRDLQTIKTHLGIEDEVDDDNSDG